MPSLLAVGGKAATALAGKAVTSLGINIVNLYDIMNNQYDVIDLEGGTTFGSNKGYWRELVSDMSMVAGRYTLSIQKEVHAERSHLSELMLQQARGDEDTARALFLDAGVDKEAVDYIFRQMKTKENDDLEQEYSHNVLHPLDKSASSLAQLWREYLFDNNHKTAERFLRTQGKLYKAIKDNPNVPGYIKDDMRLTPLEESDLLKFIEGARDLALTASFEALRNEHESFCGVINASRMARNEWPDHLEESNFKTYASYHKLLQKDKTIFNMYIPTGAEQQKEIKEGIYKAIKMKAEEYKERGKKSSIDWENIDPEKIAKWAVDPETAERFTKCFDAYFENVELGNKRNMQSQFRSIGQKSWGPWVNSIHLTALLGESERQGFMTMFYKMGMEYMDKEITYATKQFLNNEPYYLKPKSITKPHPTDESQTITTYEYVENLQDWLKEDKNRRYFYHTHGYVFDYDGEDPETFSKKDASMLARKSLLRIMHQKNPARHFGWEGEANSLKAAFDSYELLKGSVVFMQPETWSKLPDGNLVGSVIKYKKYKNKHGEEFLAMGDSGIYLDSLPLGKTEIPIEEAERQGIKAGDPVILFKHGNKEYPLVHRREEKTLDSYRANQGYIGAYANGVDSLDVHTTIAHMVEIRNHENQSAYYIGGDRDQLITPLDSTWDIDEAVRTMSDPEGWHIEPETFKQMFEMNIVRDLSRLKEPTNFERSGVAGEMLAKISPEVGGDINKVIGGSLSNVAADARKAILEPREGSWLANRSNATKFLANFTLGTTALAAPGWLVSKMMNIDYGNDILSTIAEGYTGSGIIIAATALASAGLYGAYKIGEVGAKQIGDRIGGATIHKVLGGLLTTSTVATGLILAWGPTKEAVMDFNEARFQEQQIERIEQVEKSVNEDEIYDLGAYTLVSAKEAIGDFLQRKTFSSFEQIPEGQTADVELAVKKGQQILIYEDGEEPLVLSAVEGDIKIKIPEMTVYGGYRINRSDGEIYSLEIPKGADATMIDHLGNEKSLNEAASEKGFDDEPDPEISSQIDEIMRTKGGSRFLTQ